MQIEVEPSVEAEPKKWAEHRYRLAAVELALADNGSDPSRLRKAIAFFEEALTVFTEAAHPLQWARTLSDLAYARWQLPGGNRTSVLTVAQEEINRVLRLLTEAAMPTEWADAQNTLGLILCEWGAPGARAANVREAVACYEAAARVRSRSANLWAWAVTQNNLGRALHELPDPDRAGNLRRAIACYEEALVVFDRLWHRSDWAMVQNNLGNALVALPVDDERQRPANLHRAAECYRAALGVHTERHFPHHWALAQSNLGNIYVEQKEGERDANLRIAIDCYEASLRVFTEVADPFEWARVQDNLGIAYRNLQVGDRSANVKRALSCHQAALRVYTEDSHPLKWAQALINLGFSHKYALPPADDPDQCRRLAAECFAATLRLYTEAEFPIQRANALAYLAHQYWTMQTGARQANLQRALARYGEALCLRDVHGVAGSDWAWNHFALAGCHRDLPAAGKERIHHLERAINHYVASLKFYLRESFPNDWARSWNCLARIYHNFGTENFGIEEDAVDRESNLRLAIAAYRAATEVYQERGPGALVWAGIQANLALCYDALTTGHRRENLARVSACFEGALRVRTKAAHPDLWAATYQSMGFLCLSRRGWDQACYVPKAIECFRRALTVQRGRPRNATWAVLQTQLGRAYLGLGTSGSERRQNLRRAVRCFRNALSFFNPVSHALNCAWAQQNLARAYRALAGSMRRAQDASVYLRKAAISFRAALDVYTAEAHPAMHAGLQADLATVERAAGKIV